MSVPVEWQGGLLDRSTARYFYKWLKTSLHKPICNLLKTCFLENVQSKINYNFYNKSFCNKQIQDLTMVVYLTKWDVC